MMESIHIYLRGEHGRDFEGRVGVLHSIEPVREGDVLVGARITVLRPILGMPIPLRRRMIELPINDSYLPAEVFNPSLEEMIIRHKYERPGRFELLCDWDGAKTLRSRMDKLSDYASELEIMLHFLYEQLKSERSEKLRLRKELYGTVYEEPVKNMVDLVNKIEKAVRRRDDALGYGYLSPEERERKGRRREREPVLPPVEEIEPEVLEKKTGLLASVRRRLGV